MFRLFDLPFRFFLEPFGLRFVPFGFFFSTPLRLFFRALRFGFGFLLRLNFSLQTRLFLSTSLRLCSLLFLFEDFALEFFYFSSLFLNVGHGIHL